MATIINQPTPPPLARVWFTMGIATPSATYLPYAKFLDQHLYCYIHTQYYVHALNFDVNVNNYWLYFKY